MAALINPISLGMPQSLLYRIPRTISVTYPVSYCNVLIDVNLNLRAIVLRRVKAASSRLPFCLFCAHTVSAAIILADRRLLQSAERKRFGEIRVMTVEIREHMGRISESLTRMSEGLNEHLRGMNDSLRGMDDCLRAMTDDLREIGNNIEPCVYGRWEVSVTRDGEGCRGREDVSQNSMNSR